MRYQNAPAHIRAAVRGSASRWETTDGTPALALLEPASPPSYADDVQLTTDAEDLWLSTDDLGLVVRVRRIGKLADAHGRTAWAWQVWTPAAETYAGHDLTTPEYHRPLEVARALAGFLEAYVEGLEHERRTGRSSDNSQLFEPMPEHTAEAAAELIRARLGWDN